MGTIGFVAGVCLQMAIVSAGGLVGYGLYPYTPFCAFTCLNSLDSFALSCSQDVSSAGGDRMESMATTTPQCRANNTAWLTSLAYCVQSKCSGEHAVLTSELESFWERQSTESATVAPKWGFVESLQQIESPPTEWLSDTNETLNRTVLAAPGTYLEQYNALSAVQREVSVESTYGIIILAVGAGIPLALTWAAYVPFLAGNIERFRPYLVYPSIFRTYHAQPLPYLPGNAPTRGQAFYLSLFIGLNIVLSAIDYQSRQPHAWYADRGFEIAAYVAYRTGVYAFVLLPLLILFSSRNNFLLWLTNWSLSTFMLLHRWIARLFVTYALIHSLVFVALWSIDGNYSQDSTAAWWRWGVVATVLACAMLVSSALWLRRKRYETFLLLHIALAAFVLVGMYYHVVLWLPAWGWQTWLYVAIAVWAFDRVARIARIAVTGAHWTRVTNLGCGYLRLDIDGVRWNARPGQHAFCYFPRLAPFAPWESHPFSIVPTDILNQHEGVTNGGHGDEERHDNKDDAHGWGAVRRRTTAGISLFIKQSAGVTRHIEESSALLTLLEGPYSASSASQCLSCDRVLLVGGGIGITGLITWASHHPNVKLCWSVKDSAKCLVEAFGCALSGIKDTEVKIGSRLHIDDLLEEEIRAGWERVGVVVSGPPEMCDAVRAAVVKAARASNVVFELAVESFSF